MSFGPEYVKIQTLWKRDSKGVIIPESFSTPEIGYLADAEWMWTEKVDGTNIRLHWNGESVTIGGRTNNAQIPTTLLDALKSYQNPELWQAVFPDCDNVTIYGEGYGARIQKGGGNYRKDQGIIVFDVLVDFWWLSPLDVSDVCAKMGLEVVPDLFVDVMTLRSAWNLMLSGALQSYWPNVNIEGMVGRPAVDLYNRKGERIMVKMKVRDLEQFRKAHGYLPAIMVKS